MIDKQWFVDYINTHSRDEVGKMIGRALLALLKRQTESERVTNTTRIHNNVGFSAADARSGTLTAKSFMKNGGKLLDWQIDKWIKPDRNGFPRISRYAKQLNEIAMERKQAA